MTAPSPPPARITLYWSAIWRGAVSTITFALPLAVLQGWLVSSNRIDGSDALNLLLYLAIMSTGSLGGFAASKLAPLSRLQNGAAAAALAAVAIQGGADVRHALVGEDLAGPLVWVFLALLMSTFGMIGAWVDQKTSPGPTSTSNGVTP